MLSTCTYYKTLSFHRSEYLYLKVSVLCVKQAQLVGWSACRSVSLHKSSVSVGCRRCLCVVAAAGALWQGGDSDWLTGATAMATVATGAVQVLNGSTALWTETKRAVVYRNLYLHVLLVKGTEAEAARKPWANWTKAARYWLKSYSKISARDCR